MKNLRKNSFRKSYLIFFNILFSLPLYAQYQCTGSFQNFTSIKQQELTSVQVRLLQSGIIIKFISINPNQKFELANIEKGKYTLSVVGNYFNSWDTSFQIIDKNISNIIIPLLPLSKNLDTVIITAKRSVYYKRKDTIVFNAKQYIRGNEKSLKDLVNNLPGASVTNSGKIAVNGQVVRRLLLEGKDLTGEDYSKIVNNMGVSNIKEIQLIQNYIDKFHLSYNLRDSMLAMNITFTKKRGIITTARLGLGAGAPNKFYEANTDILGDKKKLTFLFLANTNNRGYSFEQLSNSNFVFYNAYQNSMLKAREGNKFLNTVREPFYINIEKNAYLFNNTSLLDLSTELRISNSCRTKTIITLAPEKINIFKNNFSESFIGDSLLANTSNEGNSLIKSNSLQVKSETVKMFSKRSQLIVRLNNIQILKNANNVETINTVESNIIPENNLYLTTAKIEYNQLPTVNTRFSVHLFVEAENNAEILQSSGIAYKGVFLPADSGDVNNFKQHNYQNQKQFGAALEFSKTKGRSQLILNIIAKRSDGIFDNNLIVKTRNNINLSIDSFNQFLSLKRTVILPSISYISWIGNYYLNTNSSLQYIPTQKQNLFIEKNNVNFQSKFSVGRNFENNRISVIFEKSVEYPNNEYLPKPMIVDYGNIYKAPTDFFAKKNITSVGFIFSSNNMQGFSSKYNFSINYSKEKTNYITTPIVNNFYTVESLLFNPNITNNLNIVLGSFFKFNKASLLYEPKLTYDIAITPVFQNNIFINSNSKSWNYSQLVKRVGLQKVNFSLQNDITRNVFLNNKKILYKSLNSATNATLDYMIAKKFFFVTQLQHIYYDLRNDQKAQNFYFFNFTTSYSPIKTKFNFSLSWRNVLNSKYFILQNSTATFYSISKTKLLPSHLFFKMSYTF